ncbi:MAG: hypothetical protein IKK15_02490 [Akkermansia sp.]|nr:hypothetical protein [Akkermansia sp.]
MKLPFSYYLQLLLGLGASFMLGISAYGTVNLPETMRASNSPFVQGAPYLQGMLNFITAWFSYAFFAAAANSRRIAQKRPIAPWGCAAFYFAVILTTVLALVYVFCSHIHSFQQGTQCVGTCVLVGFPPARGGQLFLLRGAMRLA